MAIHPVDATLEAAKIDPDQRAERLKGVKLDGAGWKYALTRALKEFGNDGGTDPVSYTHLTLPTTPYV